MSARTYHLGRDYRPVHPPKAVEVFHNGRWWPGRLASWGRSNGEWRGLTRWSEDWGMTYLQAVPSDRLRIGQGRP